MKKLLALLVFVPTAVFAKPTSFKYQTPCFLENQGTYYEDVCTVVETRESTGFLKTRNIFSNKWSLTIKSRFDKVKGFVTWDSHNKFEYPYQYSYVEGKGSMVMPSVIIQEVSWD